MSHDIHIVDCEARTAIGLTATTTMAALRAGISRVGEHPFMLDPAGDPLRVVSDGQLPPEVVGFDRVVALAEAPLHTLRQRFDLDPRGPVRLLVSVPEPRPGWTATYGDALARHLSTALAGKLGAVSAQVLGTGHAGAIHSISAAVRELEARHADLIVVGGVDSYLHPDTIDWLFANRQLVTKRTRSSFLPGEGAAYLVLASDRARRSLRMGSLAVLRGHHAANEPVPIKSDEESFGLGLTSAVRQAIAGMGGGQMIDEVYCDINGERYRSQEWGFVALRLGQRFRDPSDYVAPADRWGDVGAATLPMLCAAATAGWRRGYAKGARALIVAGSESGLRGAVLLEQPTG